MGAPKGVGALRGHWGLSGEIEAIRGVRGALEGQQGYRWHHGALRCVGGVHGASEDWEHQGAPRGVRGALGAGRKCRHSGASRGIGGIRGS